MSRTWLLLPLLLLYLYNLGGAGFGLDPDEPRYASIGREMAHSGDWVTPRLNGSPWFEKPPLLYWMTAGASKLGLRDEWAARLPVALLSLAFLAFFFAIVEREFSGGTAMLATAILGTSAGWIGYSFAAVTDLPMAVMFNAAMLIALFDTRPRRGRPGGRWPLAAGWIAGGLLGLAILAKAFLPLVLFAPVWLIARGKRLAIVAGAILVAGPWHLLVWLRNGPAFWNVYFWQQQVSRASSPSFHPQPFWFYVPVLLLGLFPWTPLFALLARRKIYGDVRVSSLLIWLGLALLFFSSIANKLPGYLLALLPAVAIVLAVALEKSPAQEWWVAGCVLLLALTPTIARVLPEALLAGGLSHAPWPLRWSGLLLTLPPAAGAWWLAFRRQVAFAVLAGALAAAVGTAYLKAMTLPVLDQRVGARPFWKSHQALFMDQAETGEVCLDPGTRRQTWYALEYYAQRKLPECPPQALNHNGADTPLHIKFRIVSTQEGLALVAKTP